MGNTMMDRRTFSQLLAMSLAATAAPVLPAWAQGKKRNVVIGHTGITWPGRIAVAPAAPPPPPPDPALNETIFKDVSELGFAGLELFDWQIDGLESQGLLGQIRREIQAAAHFELHEHQPDRSGAARRRRSRTRSTSARS